MGMFAKAPTATTKPASKAKAKDITVPTKDLHVFCALKAVATNVAAQIAVIESGIKSTMMAKFVEMGALRGSKPESYRGEEHGSTGSLQFKCRSSASGLTEEEQTLLNDEKIPFDENIVREDTFIINPAYADLSIEENAERLGKVEEALAVLGLPADFIQKQEKVSKHIVTDATIDAICSLKTKGKPDTAKIAALLPVVGVLSITPKLAEGANPFQIVEEALGSPEGLDKVAA